MIGRRAASLSFLGLATLIWLGIGGELLCRFEGNWQFETLKLVPRSTRPATVNERQERDQERALLEQITYQKGIDPNWFFLPPAHVDKPANPELQARTAANPNMYEQENYVWNAAVIEHPDEHTLDLLRTLKEDDLFAFTPYDGSVFPRYRLYPNNDYRPVPWITDNYGWLSVDATVKKPPGVVRIGIIGDSTSHNLYGLQLQTYLDTWARAHGLPNSFQVLNAGRQGFGADDGLSALQYELAPMGLDYVFQYFAPAFSLVPEQMASFAKLPRGVVTGKKPAERHRMEDFARRTLAPWSDRSALARTVLEQITHQAPDSQLREPFKPSVTVHMPRGTGGRRVVLDEARKNFYFGRLLGNLDRFNSIASSLRATPLVATERLCVWDDMVLTNSSSRYLFDVVNGASFWPFSYANLRRMLAAHNGAIRSWAQANNVTLVDIDGLMPARPELCTDAHHDRPLAQRMRAWLIFQALLPLLERDLRDGTVPRDNADPSGHHPYLDKPFFRLNRAELIARAEAADRDKKRAAQ